MKKLIIAFLLINVCVLYSQFKTQNIYDSMTDERTAIVMSSSRENDYQAKLVVGANNQTVTVAVFFSGFDTVNDVQTVIYRFDNEPAEKIVGYGDEYVGSQISYMYRAYKDNYDSDVASFLNKLTKHKTLKVRVSRHNGTYIEKTFNIANFKDAVKQADFKGTVLHEYLMVNMF